MKLVAALLVTLSACNGPCWDMDPDNNESCGGPSEPSEAVGERFAANVGGAGDHYVALVHHDDFRERPGTASTSLVELDRGGAILSTTPTDLDFGDVAIVGDGAGTVMLGGYRQLRWLRGGIPIADAALEGNPAVAYGDGAFWVADDNRHRELRRFDAGGTPLPTVALPSSTWRTSEVTLAADPFGDEVVTAWVGTGTDEFAVLVDRVRDGVARTIEVERIASPGLQRGVWISSVAIRDGVIAVAFGRHGGPAYLARVAPDNTVELDRFSLPSGCEEPLAGATAERLVATPGGYAVSCRRGHHVTLYAPEGRVLATERIESYSMLVSAHDTAIVVSRDADSSVLIRTLDDRIGDAQTVYRGYIDDGCSTAPGASMPLVLAALLVLRRRRARSPRIDRR